MNSEVTKIVSKECLNPVGHDIVSVCRESGGGTTEWMECHNCHMTLSELHRNEENCFEHFWLCSRCGKHQKTPKEAENETKED